MKLFVGLAAAAVIFGMLVSFQTLLGPLLMSVLLAYILQPMVKWLHIKTRLSWGLCVSLVFLLVIVIIVGIIVVLGIGVVSQTENLITFVNDLLIELPDLLEQVTNAHFAIGPFQFDMANYDFDALLAQLANLIQPALSQAGSLVSSLASGTASTLGWGIFVLLVSYFTLADAKRVAMGQLIDVKVPGYEYDISRLGFRLGRIWNTFLRSQLFLFVTTIIASAVMNSALGVNNALALAIMAGFGRFVPYVGPFVTWVLTALIALFMPENYFGLAPFWYAVLVVGMAILLDSAFDQYITPQLYGQALGVNPGAVLVAAIVAANLIGVIGLLVSAPVLATLVLFGRYIFRKLFDLDPWPESEQALDQDFSIPGAAQVQRLRETLQNWIQSRRKKKK